MTVTTLDIKNMTGAELDYSFKQGRPGPMPIGRTRGTAIVLPGTAPGRVLTSLVRLLAWKGKVFNPDKKDLLNMVSPFGFRAIRATTYLDASWVDGEEAIIIDYSKTSFVAQKIRDEIREVTPGVYIGQVFWGRTRILRFVLEV